MSRESTSRSPPGSTATSRADTSSQRVEKKYRKHLEKKRVFLVATTGALVFFVLLGMTLGAARLSLGEVVLAVLGQGTPAHGQIVWRIRLPRVLAAALAGMALAASGAAMQSILRNPLGSPFTLGISHAAAFGAAFAIIIVGAGTMHSTYGDAVVVNNPYVVTLSAFGWCLVATLVVLLVAKLRQARPQTLILVGIVLGSLFTAGTTALQYFANDVQLAAIVFWTFGDLGRADWVDFGILGAITIPSVVYFTRMAWNYNALDAGDEVATSLGVRTERVRSAGMVLASLLTAAVISFFGIIAYVGLVVPHLVRKILGAEERHLVPACALFGGLFLLVADTIARTILSPVILPVGVLTSFLGAPLFLYLLVRKKEGAW